MENLRDIRVSRQPTALRAGPTEAQLGPERRSLQHEVLPDPLSHCKSFSAEAHAVESAADA